MDDQTDSAQNVDVWVRTALEPNRRWLMTYVISMVGNPVDAEDIVQRVLGAAWENRAKYDGSRPLGAWLRGIARNLVRRHWAERQKQPVFVTLESLDTLDFHSEHAEAEALDEVRTEKRMEALRECVGELTERARKILRLKYHQRVRSAEIGKMLGRTANAVDNLLSRVRRNLLNCVSTKMEAMGP